ncbi:hypothetical protein ACIBJF_44090 [Streptomyces sp. NPDC050743]|uniref:hypothetical protein n=1 Tax=Streptomyces sp. NPDC050743 TaxID=3365634 RepID=UPI0037B48A83
MLDQLRDMIGEQEGAESLVLRAIDAGALAQMNFRSEGPLWQLMCDVRILLRFWRESET